MQANRRRFMALGAMSFVAACANPGDVTATRDDSAEIETLAAAIKRLNGLIDPAEADRAAKIAYNYTQTLAISYQIEDPPLIHNIKVNNGEKPRGLCWHWAEDMEKRLARENFQTLDLHRAIANAFNRVLIDHSTVIVSGPGDTMQDGIVIDPWRYGGTLFWAPFFEDTRYTWVRREDVFARKIEILRRKGELPGATDPSTEPLPVP